MQKSEQDPDVIQILELSEREFKVTVGYNKGSNRKSKQLRDDSIKRRIGNFKTKSKGNAGNQNLYNRNEECLK